MRRREEYAAGIQIQTRAHGKEGKEQWAGAGAAAMAAAEACERRRTQQPDAQAALCQPRRERKPCRAAAYNQSVQVCVSGQGLQHTGDGALLLVALGGLRGPWGRREARSAAQRSVVRS